MFEDIGGKIKTLAAVTFVIVAVVFFILGCILMYNSMILLGLLVAAIGFGIGYIGSFFIYGFGQLIQNTDIIVSDIKRRRKQEEAEKTASVHAPEKRQAPVFTPKTVPTYAANAPAAPAPSAYASNPSSAPASSAYASNPSAAPASIDESRRNNLDVPVRINKNGSGQVGCPLCGAMQRDNRFRCFSCGVRFVNGQPGVPFWCGNCGKEGPFDEECPECKSTMKVFNEYD